MSIITTIKKYFASIGNMATMPTDKVSATTTITNNLVGYLQGLSDFNSLSEDEIYEQLYVWEPEIGGGIDRISTMVGESFKYFFLHGGSALESVEQEMVDEANSMSETVNIRHNFEVFSELLIMHGNYYIEHSDDLTLNILPNKHITILDKLERLTKPSISGEPDDVITAENYLCLYEGTQSQRIIKKDNFVHVKYKSTPVFCKDNKGRVTYGVYSPSPLHRVILPVWWKRQTMITDILWRLRNVPREHHKISADMFSLDKYAGDLTTKRTAANTDANTFLLNYVKGINTLMPDQGYATLDTVDISMIENSNSNYMQTNELIKQINEQIWGALNLPKSMVAGESHSSYASELVISNYVAQKVLQIGNRIKPMVLENVRKRLLLINSSYPTDKLDIKLDLNIAATELETYRQAAIMATLPFTETEIRESMGYSALRDDQIDDLFYTKQQSANSPFGTGNTTDNTNTNLKYPQTPSSDIQHSTDRGQSKYRNIERGV